MKLALVIALLAACGGPKPKPESPLVNEGSDVPETCCCKSFPLTSEDGKPVYGMAPRMECSARPGECVPDVQCREANSPSETAPSPAPSASPGPGAGSGSEN